MVNKYAVTILFLVPGFSFIGCQPVGSSDIRNRNPTSGVKVELKVAACQPTNLPGLGDAILGVADRVRAMTSGRIELNVQEPGALVPALEVLDAVSSGTVESGFGPAGFWAGKMPAAPLFSAIPFGPEAGEYIAWMYHGDGLELEQRMYSDAGFQVVSLPCALLAAETSGWFRKPVDTVEDLRGLKMRFYGLGGQVMQELGVAVTVMPGGEIYQALEKNILDATEFSMPAIDEKLGFSRVAKYNYYPGWHQQATLLELLINKSIWDSLSKVDQSIISNACQAAMLDSFAKSEALQADAIRRNTNERGVHNRMWSPEMLALYEATWHDVVSREAARDPFFKEVWEDLQAFRSHYREWGGRAFLPRKRTSSQ
ncbi:MAG: TRAP transporter substrate-binding protein [Planctomycetaceae bacterium]|nr:TRAP transporter substrate-binding protein [Planctomycetaceae bacterium]MBT7727840.1 TRAP transporter substrate-binding protein [Planctomycetaceae bacterium]